MALGYIQRINENYSTTPTPREREVIALVAAGLGAGEIAKRLCISVRTVHTHLSGLYARIEANGAAHAVAICVRRGYITL